MVSYPASATMWTASIVNIGNLGSVTASVTAFAICGDP